MSRFQAGVVSLVLIAGLSLAGWFRFNPFASPYELNAVFADAGNLRTRSPVRIAGIDVGKVTKVEPLEGGRARVEMELQDRALPIHADAELKVRPRLFFGGNYFVDVEPGSPSAPTLEDGGTIPATQTAAPVQAGDVLAALKADTRANLRTLVEEYARGLEGGGADGLRQALPQLAPAYRGLALTSDAALGKQPDEDVQRALRGTQRTVAALDEDEGALKGLVTGLAGTAQALASEDTALAASLPELRDLLRTAYPALATLNRAFPPLRTLAREALPGARRLGPTVTASLPFVRQARALVRPTELRGTARVLQRRLRDLFRLVGRSVPLFGEGRAASRCLNRVLVPFITSDFPDPDFPSNSGTVNQKIQRSFVGLAGESRTVDANQSYFHTSVVPPPLTFRPAPPPEGVQQPPPRRPDVPCETQEPPNLNAPGARLLPNGALVPLSASGKASGGPSLATRRRALLRAKPLVADWQRRLQRRGARILARERRR